MLELSDYRRTSFYISRAIATRGARGLWNITKMFLTLRHEPNVVNAEPIAIQVEPTTICDLGCGYCIHHLLSNKKCVLSPVRFTQILDAFPFAIKLTLQGIGEPLLHPAFGELVRIAKNRQLWVQTFTNGSHLYQKAEELIASQIDRVNVSLDTVSQPQLTALRPGADVNVILRGIHRILDSPIELHVYAVAAADTLSSLDETVTVLANAGVRNFHLQGCHSFGSSALAIEQDAAMLLASQEALTAAVVRCKQMCRQYGITFRGSAEELISPSQERHCQWPWYKAYVSCMGAARFCCRNIQSHVASPGNVLETNWRSIWNNDAYRAFRNDLRSSEIPQHCQGCAAYYLEY